MSRWKRPLTARDVRRILVALGFHHRDTTGGHEQWVRAEPLPFRKVTLSPHNAPFAGTIVRYMALQAGADIRSFYDACDK